MKTKAIILFLMTLSFAFAADKKEENKKKDKRLHAITSGNAKSIMMIDPRDRANDFISAFNKMRAEISPAKIYFDIQHDKPINNVLSVELMQYGTLMLFRISSAQGEEIKVVPIEDVLEIMHIP